MEKRKKEGVSGTWLINKGTPDGCVKKKKKGEKRTNFIVILCIPICANDGTNLEEKMELNCNPL